MRLQLFLPPTLLVSLCLAFTPLGAQDSSVPHLEKRGAATQLIVDGKPFLMLSGELHNSSSSSLDYMKPIWPKLEALGLNTVVTPLSWELIEPKEGSLDFTLVDGLIDQARQSHQRIVFLWLASWKNGMSSYAPAWVKQDTHRFQRVVQHGNAIEVLSPMCPATQEADSRAFAALMRHIRQVDGTEHTVLMMQIENEVGVLGDSRDRSAEAGKIFSSPVPAQLTAYLASHRDQLYPDLHDLWVSSGARTSGTWPEVFGDTERADEIFMAWHYARFIQAVGARGKAEYNIPMYVNTWLAGETTPPGQYPSGGPQPRVIDIWKAAKSDSSPGLDFYSPDLYDPNFEQWCRRYHRDGNPLYMPETVGEAAGAANVFYALGEEAGFGFSPFAIESEADDKDPLGDSYKAIGAIAPLLLQHQSAGDVHGFVLDPGHSTVDFTINGFTLHVSLDKSFDGPAASGFGLIMADGKGSFLGLGKGFRVTFTPRDDAASQAGIAAVDDGSFSDGKWIPARRLNGDEDDQGVAWRFSPRTISTEKISLYRVQ